MKPMTQDNSIAEQARRFWFAAKFYRQAHDRDRTQAIKIIHSLTRSPFGRIAALSRLLMRDIKNDQRRSND